jgi:hypothetical protein
MVCGASTSSQRVPRHGGLLPKRESTRFVNYSGSNRGDVLQILFMRKTLNIEGWGGAIPGKPSRGIAQLKAPSLSANEVN